MSGVFVKSPVISICLMVLVMAITNSRKDFCVETRSKADMLSTATRCGLNARMSRFICSRWSSRTMTSG